MSAAAVTAAPAVHAVTAAAATADHAAPAAAAALAAAAEQVPVNRRDAPLLFVFMLPMLAIVGLVLWIGQSPTWLLVGLTMATIVVMTFGVMLAIKRLLDDGDGEGNPDVVPH